MQEAETVERASADSATCTSTSSSSTSSCGGAGVYLDHNATTPLAPAVLEEIASTLRGAWGNPSSTHVAGVRARECIVKARKQVARMINGSPQDIIFTSGGTESNNLVFHSVARWYYSSHACSNTSVSGNGARPALPHFIVSNLEHDSVTSAVSHMQQQGLIEYSVVTSEQSSGRVSIGDVLGLVRPSTVLVSLMLANNETGLVQPVRELVAACRRLEGEEGGTACVHVDADAADVSSGGEKKEKERRKRRIFIHTDAAQALGKIPVDVQALGVDYLTIVGHKFYGPRVGALYVCGLEEQGAPLVPLMYGGGQERGYRPGTENTGMIAGLGKACELVADNVEEYSSHMQCVRDYLEEQLEVNFGGRIHFNGRIPGSPKIPNTCNFSILGEKLQGHRILSNLRHSQASIGAACHSHLFRPSPILLSLGIPEEIALNALRTSVGRETTKSEIDLFIEDLKDTVKRLQS